MEAMICGMTPQERRNPQILNASGASASPKAAA